MKKSQSKKNILITSGRSPIALDLARKFHASGHRVSIADTMTLHLSRFSKAVANSYKIPSPRLKPEGFTDRMAQIARDEKIDLIVPIYEEILYLSKGRHKFPSHCEIFATSFSLLNELHNKWLFTLKLRELGIEVPPTYLISSQQDLQKLDRTIEYALKASYSRASLGFKKLSLGQETPPIIIESHNAWIAQGWLEGDKFCTYSICRDGVVKAHAVYPVGYTANKQGCIVFEAVEHPKILKWIEHFVDKINFTGQIAFDFIETKEGKIFAIECNPRATSGAHLFDEFDNIDTAFFGENEKLIYPIGRIPKQFGIGMLLYGWRKNSIPNNNFGRFSKTFFSSKDVVYDRLDPMPLLAQPLIFSGILYHSIKKGLSFPAFFMYDYEWNGEVK